MIVPLKITLWDDQTQLKRMSYGIKQGCIESQVMPTWNMHSLQLNMRLYIYIHIYIYINQLPTSYTIPKERFGRTTPNDKE